MATVDVGDEVFESFGDMFEADTYLTGDVLRAAGWLARTEDEKGRGLASATRMMLSLPWCDEPPTIEAAPDLVKEISFMLAADLLAKPQLFRDASGDSNVKSAGAGSARVEFFRPVEGGPPIPVDLWNRLVRAGLVGCVDSDASDGAFVSGACGSVRPLGGRYPWEWATTEQDYD